MRVAVDRAPRVRMTLAGPLDAHALWHLKCRLNDFDAATARLEDPDAACAAWAGVCPGNNESVGKCRSRRPGNPTLRATLAECAHGAPRAPQLQEVNPGRDPQGAGRGHTPCCAISSGTAGCRRTSRSIRTGTPRAVAHFRTHILAGRGNAGGVCMIQALFHSKNAKDQHPHQPMENGSGPTVAPITAGGHTPLLY